MIFHELQDYENRLDSLSLFSFAVKILQINVLPAQKLLGKNVDKPFSGAYNKHKCSAGEKD